MVPSVICLRGEDDEVIGVVVGSVLVFVVYDLSALERTPNLAGASLAMFKDASIRTATLEHVGPPRDLDVVPGHLLAFVWVAREEGVEPSTAVLETAGGAGRSRRLCPVFLHPRAGAGTVTLPMGTSVVRSLQGLERPPERRGPEVTDPPCGEVGLDSTPAHERAGMSSGT